MLRFVKLIRKCNLHRAKKNAHASARDPGALKNPVGCRGRTLQYFSSTFDLWHSSSMIRNRWNLLTWGLILSLALCLAACEPPPEPVSSDPDLCDPLIDLETCDGQGRLQCDAVSRIWVFIATCEPMTHCIETEADEPGRAMTTQCVVEKEL